MNTQKIKETARLLRLLGTRPLTTAKVAVQTAVFIERNGFEVRDEHKGPAATLAEGMNKLLEQQRSEISTAYEMRLSAMHLSIRLLGRVLSETVARTLQVVGDVEQLLAELKEVKSPNGSTKKAIRRLEEIIAQPEVPTEEVPADQGGIDDVEADAAAEEAAADA